MQPPPIYFAVLVERIHADHLAAGREVSKEDVVTIARATLRLAGVHLDSVSGQLHTRMRTEPAQQNVRWRGGRRPRGYRR